MEKVFCKRLPDCINFRLTDVNSISCFAIFECNGRPSRILFHTNTSFDIYAYSLSKVEKAAPTSYTFSIHSLSVALLCMDKFVNTF